MVDAEEATSVKRERRRKNVLFWHSSLTGFGAGVLKQTLQTATSHEIDDTNRNERGYVK